jgi:hypothetical protein
MSFRAEFAAEEPNFLTLSIAYRVILEEYEYQQKPPQPESRMHRMNRMDLWNFSRTRSRRRSTAIPALTATESLETRQLLSARTIQLAANRDTTIYDPLQGDVANGSGQYLVTGGGADSEGTHRSLLSFDVNAAAIPDGATILDAVLTLNVAWSSSGTSSVSIHKLLSLWGEGESDASGDESLGASAEQFDATWLFRMFDTSAWATPGGDFQAAASASASVSGTGPVEWSGAGLLDDVQQWLDDPNSNFGWILDTDASSDGIKAFHSRTSGNAALVPILEITYEEPLLTGIIEGRKWHDANADGHRPPTPVSQLNLELRNQQNYFNQFGGREYWYFSSSNRSWYFLRPDGSLTQWNRQSRSLSGSVVAQLPQSFYYNPGAVLTNSSAQPEPWLNGVTIELLDGDGTVVASTTTRDIDRNEDGTIDPETEQGWYRFDGLAPDRYRVREIVPEGWEQSASGTSPLADEVFSLRTQLGLTFAGTWYENSGGRGERWLRATRGWVYITPTGDLYRWNGRRATSAAPLSGTHIIHLGMAYFQDPSLIFLSENPDIDLQTGETIHQQNFGNYQPGQIRGRVWRDSNADGVFNPVGLGTLVPTSVLPNNVPIGDFTWFAPAAGSNPGRSAFYYIDGDSLYLWTSAGGSVFISSIPDGVTPSPTASPLSFFQDEGWLNGWTVQLLDTWGNVIAVDVTHDIDLNQNGSIEPDTERGWYSFDRLLPGEYTVRQLPMDGWLQTSAVPTEFQAPLSTLQQQYDFRPAATDWFNWGGRNERWFRGRSGEWFYTTPTGDVFKWDRKSGGTRGRVNGTSAGVVSSSAFVNLNLLFTTTQQKISVQNNEVVSDILLGNHNVSDGFFASMTNELLGR